MDFEKRSCGGLYGGGERIYHGRKSRWVLRRLYRLKTGMIDCRLKIALVTRTERKKVADLLST